MESSIDNALIKLEKEYFDVVLMNSVLEHLWNPGDVLIKMFQHNPTFWDSFD